MRNRRRLNRRRRSRNSPVHRSSVPFSTIRLCHRRTKGSGIRRASLAKMFKLAHSAERRWQCLDGHEHIAPLLQGKLFVDGIMQDAAQQNLKTLTIGNRSLLWSASMARRKSYRTSRVE